MKKASITKDEIAILDKVSYNGIIHIIDSLAKVKAAIAYLSKQDIVGFDTETRPSFKKGVLRNMALMQIATLEECFLFRINTLGIPELLKDFLENGSIIKIGLSIKDDFNVLRRSYPNFSPRNFIELQKLVEDFNINDKSLQKIYAILFNKRISKSQRLTNWEAPTLTEAQQEYAAIDAHACLEIYKYLNSGSFIAEKNKYYREIVEPIPNNTNEKI